MKQLMKRFSRVADSSTATTPFCIATIRPRRSRSGHVPVYVGEEMRRFVVTADLMNHPIFAKLLKRSAEEYGYQQKGVLRIPCHVSDFERLLDVIRSGGRGVSGDVLRLLDIICSDD